MITLLIYFLVAVCVIAIVYWVLSVLPLPSVARTIAIAVLAIIALIWIVSYLPPLSHHPLLH